MKAWPWGPLMRRSRDATGTDAAASSAARRPSSAIRCRSVKRRASSTGRPSFIEMDGTAWRCPRNLPAGISLEAYTAVIIGPDTPVDVGENGPRGRRQVPGKRASSIPRHGHRRLTLAEEVKCCDRPNTSESAARKADGGGSGGGVRPPDGLMQQWLTQRGLAQRCASHDV